MQAGSQRFKSSEDVLHCTFPLARHDTISKLPAHPHASEDRGYIRTEGDREEKGSRWRRMTTEGIQTSYTR